MSETPSTTSAGDWVFEPSQFSLRLRTSIPTTLDTNALATSAASPPDALPSELSPHRHRFDDDTPPPEPTHNQHNRPARRVSDASSSVSQQQRQQPNNVSSRALVATGGSSLTTATTPSPTHIAVFLERIHLLEQEVQARQWAVDRSVELSRVTANLRAENETMRQSLADAHAKIDDLERLVEEQKQILERRHRHAVQQNSPRHNNLQKRRREATFRAEWETDGGGTSHLDPHTGSGYAVRPPLSFYGTPCFTCFFHREQRDREEVICSERDAFFALDSRFSALLRPFHFSAAQRVELEQEQMFQEDCYSHQRMVREMEQKLRKKVRFDDAYQELETEISKWKKKHHELKVAGKKHVEELIAVQEENLRRARTKYLRCNPNYNVLSWAFWAMSIFARANREGNLLLADLFKELQCVKMQLQFFKEFVKTALQQTAQDMQHVIEVCKPVMSWKSVQKVPVAATAASSSSVSQMFHHHVRPPPPR